MVSAFIAVIVTHNIIEAKYVHVEPVESFADGVILAPDAGINIKGRDEKLYKLSSVIKGTNLQVVQKDGVTDSLIFDEENYIHCVYDNVDCWIFSDYLAVDSVPAVIIEKCSVFNDETLQGEQIASFRFGSVIASGYIEEDTTVVLVYWFDKKSKKVLTGFVAAENVSTYMDDVQVAAIIEKLRVTHRAVPRNELFKKAYSLNPSPKMKVILDGEQVEKIEYSYKEVVKTLPGKRYSVNVDELNTVDQSKDPFVN